MAETLNRFSVILPETDKLILNKGYDCNIELQRMLDINTPDTLRVKEEAIYNVFNHVYENGLYFNPAIGATSANGGIEYAIKDEYNNSILKSPLGEDIETSLLYTMAEQGTGIVANKEVVTMGDSISAGVIPGGGTPYYTRVTNLLTSAGYSNISLHNEGIQGWTWALWTSDHASNPFWNNGGLDFANYCTNEGISQIDMMTCMLGINDTTTSSYNINDMVADMKTFFDALLSEFPNCEILILQQPNGAMTPDFRVRYRRMFELHKAEIINFDGSEYDSNIKLVPLYALVNNNCYESSSLAINSMGDTIPEFSDMVHPNDNGHELMGNLTYAAIVYYLT